MATKSTIPQSSQPPMQSTTKTSTRPTKHLLTGHSLTKLTQISLLNLSMLVGSLSIGAGLTAALLPTPAHAKISTTDFSDLVSQVSPGVARVNVTKKISEEALAKAQTAKILREFFGDRINIPESSTIPAVERSYGSAFFISKDGYLLTNHHVIAGADTITISLNDRTELDATLVGSDERSDIAVLKVKGSNLPALPIGSSSTLKVGEPVLAIGSPFGFDYSASAGIVSAKARNFSTEASVPFIQTDVALNPGNSGGPLFNQNGQVIGINSRIFSSSGGYMGLSFSIPIDEAMNIYQELKRNGKLTRGYIGVYAQDMDRNLAEAFGLDKPQGALIARVTADSPASDAGLKSGDLVLSYNNKKINSADELVNYFNQARPQDNFTMLVLRSGKNVRIKGKYGTEPNELQTAQSSNGSKNGISLGINLRVLTSRELAELRDYMSIEGGVLLTAVDPTGLAGRSGLQAGDIITNLNYKPITTIQSFVKAHESLPNKGVVTVEIIRSGVPAIVGLRIE